VRLDPRLYINREWSWLDFDTRVLEEAADRDTPLLERLRFCGIVSSNLDEFFMVRVAGVRHQVAAGVRTAGPCGLRPREVLGGISDRVRDLVTRQYNLWKRELMPALDEAGIRIVEPARLDAAGERYLGRYFEQVVMPVLTPLAVGHGHPFPTLVSGQLYLAVSLRPSRKALLGGAAADVGDDRARGRGGPLVFVQVPRVLPRFVRCQQGATLALVPLERVIAAHLDILLPGAKVLSAHGVRVTRDADLESATSALSDLEDTALLEQEDPASDLLAAVQKELLRRRRGAAVRLEHDAALPPPLRRRLRQALALEPSDLHACSDLLQLGDLVPLVDGLDRPDLKYDPLVPLPLGHEGKRASIFEQVRRQHRLLFHPYSSFDPVVRLVEEAASDPQVLAIKQTLYRVGSGSPVVAALVRAAESGKQVTALVELRARFDEERNIGWARRLEEAGAHVIYGLRGLKTHCKALLIVRREQDGIRRYLHLGTGNYNVTTARVYSDFGVLTTDEALGRDVGALFNVLTGYSEPPAWEKIEISPTGLRARLLRLIEREREHAARGEEARIIVKLNALVDATMIAALYDASRAGVKIDLVVRGICCLRPGIEGVSDNIRVRSIVGRYLEHARTLYFRNGGAPELYLSSADWMPRNLDRRVELLLPVEERELADLVLRILELQLADDVKARALGTDGRWSRVPEGERRINSQKATYDLLRRLTRGAPRREQRFIPVRGRRGPKRGGAAAEPEGPTLVEARPVRRARRRR